MNERITATIVTEKATINAFNPENDNMIEVECLIRKATAEKDCIAFCESKNLIFCEIMNITKGKEQKYTLDSDMFIINAIKVDKRPNGNYISRTVNVTTVTCLVYNPVTHKADKKAVVIDTKNEQKFETEVKKALKKSETPKKLLKILSTETTSILYIMPVDRFIELAIIEE